MTMKLLKEILLNTYVILDVPCATSKKFNTFSKYSKKALWT